MMDRKRHTQKVRSKMVELQKQKEALGKDDSIEDSWQAQFDKVMTVRAYDLLQLELGIDKSSLQAAIGKYSDNEQVRKLIEEDRKLYKNQ